MSAPMMKCGHAANAILAPKGKPVCVICYPDVPGSVVIDTDSPNLDGRVARCAQCKREVPSATNLAFFEYRGPGSRDATERCMCGYYKSAASHLPVHEFLGSANEPYRCQVCKRQRSDHDYQHCDFAPRGGNQTDSFYCGCRGWD